MNKLFQFNKEFQAPLIFHSFTTAPEKAVAFKKFVIEFVI